MKKLILFLLTVSSIAYAEKKITGSISTDGISSKIYASLAKISMNDAMGLALGQVRGKVAEAALESEDGFLVYSFEIVGPDKHRKEVLVDAGNGQILQTEDEG